MGHPPLGTATRIPEPPPLFPPHHNQKPLQKDGKKTFPTHAHTQTRGAGNVSIEFPWGPYIIIRVDTPPKALFYLSRPLIRINTPFKNTFYRP